MTAVRIAMKSGTVLGLLLAAMLMSASAQAMKGMGPLTNSDTGQPAEDRCVTERSAAAAAAEAASVAYENTSTANDWESAIKHTEYHMLFAKHQKAAQVLAACVNKRSD